MFIGSTDWCQTVSVHLSQFNATNNSAAGSGGAVFFNVDGGRLNLSASNFLHNVAGAQGGALALRGIQFLSLEDSSFSNNSAGQQSGGAMSLVGLARRSEVRASRVQFTGNTAQRGGGLDCNNANVWLDRSSFEDNSARHEGGGIVACGCTLNLTNSTFDENRAQTGGGVFLQCDATLSLLESKFQHNHASRRGGGVHCARCKSVQLVGVELVENSAMIGRDRD